MTGPMAQGAAGPVPTCDKLQLFADGEMTDTEAQAFQRHLVGCTRCQIGLQEVMVLEALGQGMTPAAVTATPRAAATAAATATAVPADRAVTPLRPSARPPRARPLGRPVDRRLVWGGVVALAAGVALVTTVSLDHARGPSFAALVEPAARPFAARLSYAPADHHRPLRVMRGGEGSRPAPAFTTLAALEGAGDLQGVAAGYLLSGDPTEAERYLAGATRSPAVDSDRAVLAMQRGQWAQARSQLEAVLAVVPHHPQALWNLALVWQALGDPARAARGFDQVASLGEPGWAAEAAERARALRQR